MEDQIELLKEQNELLNQLIKQSKPKSHFIRNMTILFFVIFIYIQLTKTANTNDTRSVVPPSGMTQPVTFEEVSFAMYKTAPNGNGGLHGTDPNYMGIDRYIACGTQLYSPIDGTVTYAGLDGYNHYDGYRSWPQTTLLTIVGTAGEISIQHLVIDVNVGDVLVKGDPIGTESDVGYSFGCHTHTTWKPNSGYVATNVTNDFYYGELRECSLGVCKMSGFTPMNKDGTFQEGTVNCDSDCKVTASGKLTVNLLASDKCYVAAPINVPFDTAVTIDGIGTCYVADRGGFINNVQVGGYDKACAWALTNGNMQACKGSTTNNTSDEYYWLDVISYGE